jgi:hypothetical protein
MCVFGVLYPNEIHHLSLPVPVSSSALSLRRQLFAFLCESNSQFLIYTNIRLSADYLSLCEYQPAIKLICAAIKLLAH